MMQIRIRAIGVAVALLLASTAAAAQADLKIAAVRIDQIQNSAQSKAVDAQIQAEIDKRRAALDAENKQFSDDVQKYQRDKATMSVDQRDKEEKDLSTRQAQLEYDKNKAEADVKAKAQELGSAAESRVKDVIYQVAKEKGYDLVVFNTLIINPTVDITDDVLKRLNAQGSAPAK
jgi:outer membrane protein